MAEREGYNQIYRQSQLGLSLQSALEDLDDQIDPSLRQKVFNHFDRVRTPPPFRPSTCPPRRFHRPRPALSQILRTHR
jgi:hypothetical protein